MKTDISNLGELCVLLEPVLQALVVLLGQVVLHVRGVAGVQAERRVAVGGRWRLGASSLQGSVRGYHSFSFGLVKLLLLQRETTQAINCGGEEKKMDWRKVYPLITTHCPAEGAVGLRINPSYCVFIMTRVSIYSRFTTVKLQETF